MQIAWLEAFHEHGSEFMSHQWNSGPAQKKQTYSTRTVTPLEKEQVSGWVRLFLATLCLGAVSENSLLSCMLRTEM